jgi:hypothetical protein
MKKNYVIFQNRLFVFLLLIGFSIFSLVYSQISMTNSPLSYSQNFNGLAMNSPGSNVTWTDNTTIPGWFCNQTSYRTYTTTDATPTNRYWSCGSSNSSNERAFGSLMTSSTVRDWGIKLTNNTGSVMNSLTIGFDAERWYTAGTGSNFIIQYSTTVSTIGTAVANTTGASTGWTTIATINSPSTSLSYTLTSLALANGSTIFIRFFSVYMGSSSNVSLWATDNFTASWSAGCASPVFSIQPTDNQTICVGGTFTLGTVSASESPSYQWYSVGTKTNSGGSSVGSESGGNTATFTPSSATAGTYYYYCVATNGSCTTASNAVQITVNPNTAISTHPSPSGQSKFTGQSFDNISVTASGANLSYQWYRSTDNIVSSETDTPVGTNINTFTPSAAEEGTTYYYCVVSGSCGDPVTSNVTGAFIVSDPVPNISGSSSASATVNSVMTPEVYTYSYVTDENNVIAEWYTNNSYTITTTAPNGLSLSKDTENNTVTLSGTPVPGVSGTYYYQLKVDEVGGNTINATLQVNIPTPAINLSSAAGTNAQTRKAGTAIVNITYTVTNASGATVSGLPTGLSGSYDSGTYTISGTIDNAATLGTANFTVTATAYTGYEGSPVTASGSLVVRDPSQNYVAFLYTSLTPPEGANKIYSTIESNYNTTVLAPTTALQMENIVKYQGYDLIIFHEAIGSAVASGLELGKYIGQVPILNMKSHMYGKTNWPSGSGQNGSAGTNLSITVLGDYKYHPIFKGVEFSGNSVVMAGASGLIRWLTGATTTNQRVIANNSVGTSGSISILEDNTSSTAGKKYMMIALSAASEDMTSNGLLVIKNACDYLLSKQELSDTFRSKATGNWSDASSWESSSNGSTWHSDVVVPTTFATATTILAEHNVTVSAETKINSVTINSDGQLNVGAGKQLEITSAIVNNGTLIVNSDGNGTGTLLTPATISGSGTTTVQQHLTSGRNWYFASPISNATSNVIKGTEGNQLWERNVAGNAWTEITGTTADLTPGRGYIAKVAGTGVVSFTGALNNGQVQYPISSQAVTSGKFHLVGNPYPSYLDWQSVVTSNPDVMSTMWFRTKTAISEGNPTSIYTFSTVQYDGEAIDVVSGNANTSIYDMFLQCRPSGFESKMRLQARISL